MEEKAFSKVRKSPLFRITLNVDLFIFQKIHLNNFLTGLRKLSCLVFSSMKQQIFQKRFSWFCVVGLPIRKQKPWSSCAVLTLEFAQLLKASSPNWISSLKNMVLIGWSIKQFLPRDQQSCNALLMELSEKWQAFTLTVFKPVSWGDISVTGQSCFEMTEKT